MRGRSQIQPDRKRRFLAHISKGRIAFQIEMDGHQAAVLPENREVLQMYARLRTGMSALRGLGNTPPMVKIVSRALQV